MYLDFIGRAGDEVFNQMSKWQAMSGDVLKMPFVLRCSVGSKYGAQHSQDWSALCTHIPGLKVVFPATPYDTKGLLNAALNGTDPVIFLESQRTYDLGEMFQKEVPAGYYEVKIGEPDIKREGKDLTILTVGATLYRVTKAADILQEKYGISTEIIDARSLVPFNYEPVIESVKKTGKIIITGDACERGSHLKDFAQSISEMAVSYTHLMAQLTHSFSFDATQVMAYRKIVKENAEKFGLANITFNDIILFAVSRVLLNHRDLNAHFLGDKMRYFTDVNLGMAVDTPRGLLVPTIFGANKMSLNEIAGAAKDLAKQAQEGTISPDLLVGASFTVSNLGTVSYTHLDVYKRQDIALAGAAGLQPLFI